MTVDFEKKLKKHIEGDVAVSFTERSTFAQDESLFKMLPRCIVFPKSENDVQTTLAFASYEGLPVTCRGGGSSVAGQAISSGIILDSTRYLQKLKYVDENRVLVEAGMTLANLQAHLFPLGRRIAPDPGSKQWCTLAGMVSTNASGPHSLKWGSTRNHVDYLRLVMADSTMLDTRIGSKNLKDLRDFFSTQQAFIQQVWPKTEKNSSGYDLPSFFSEDTEVHGIFSGAEGTLGFVSEVCMKTIPLPKFTTLAILVFPSIFEAIAAVEELRKLKPAAIELLDAYVLRALGTANYGFVEDLGLLNAGASLWVEFEDDVPDISQLKATAVLRDESTRQHAWALRSKVSKILHQMAGDRKPLRCIEDACVPLHVLEDYVRALDRLLRRHDVQGPIFGHVGQGHLHVNPWVDIHKPDLRDRINALMDEFYELVLRFGGTISGEHGDGMLRATYAEKQWSRVWPLFEVLKHRLDPMGIMNPGKKFPSRLNIQAPMKDLTSRWTGATDFQAPAFNPRPQPSRATGLGSHISRL